MMIRSLLISCEHAGNVVPGQYASLFDGNMEALNSHRGWDPGAKEVAIWLSEQFKCPYYQTTVTRLLIDVNRSQHNPEIFSEFTEELPASEREEILNTFYRPYRESVIHGILNLPKPVLHLSVHTFTPVLNSVVRDVDVGILFDPDRVVESEVADILQQRLQSDLSTLRIRDNAPYKGIDDGFTTFIRTVLPDPDYAGIEIEINQQVCREGTIEPIQVSLAGSIEGILFR